MRCPSPRAPHPVSREGNGTRFVQGQFDWFVEDPGWHAGKTRSGPPDDDRCRLGGLDNDGRAERRSRGLLMGPDQRRCSFTESPCQCAKRAAGACRQGRLGALWVIPACFRTRRGLRGAAGTQRWRASPQRTTDGLSPSVRPRSCDLDPVRLSTTVEDPMSSGAQCSLLVVGMLSADFMTRVNPVKAVSANLVLAVTEAQRL